MTTISLESKPPRPLVEGDAAWFGPDLAARPEVWTYHLSDPERAEIAAAVAGVQARGTDIADITRADFPLPTLGLVLQGGADVMLDSHWGLTFDVKKLFADAQSHSTGINLGAIGVPGGGIVPVTGTLKTNFQPWALSTGVIYRF